MQNTSMLELSPDEMQTCGGAQYTCALLGGVAAAALITGQWWALAGALIGAYNADCFAP